jgi:cobalamin-dependent methionine synthase I
MILIADNLNTRNRAYMEALGNKNKKAVSEMAKALSEAGADLINIQCSLDGSGDEKNIPFVIEAVREAADCRLSIDTRNLDAIGASLKLTDEPPLINFLSQTEPDDADALLDLVAGAKASLVIRASKGTVPTSLEAKLQILEELIEAANESDIPNDRLFADPSIVHIGRGMGQEHIVNSHECIIALKEMVDPPINTIAWISNISSGVPFPLKKQLETSLLFYLAGAGLDAALLDMLSPEIKKAAYLIKSFRDEIVFTPADLS